MLPTLTEETVALLCKWREECRVNLLDLEKKSIFVRVCAVEKIINEKTYEINRILCINVDDTFLTPYKHYIDAETQCKFIQNWNGLNTNQMRSVPKSFQDYETRAKNWLNGRRAINYAQSLFPEMMLCADAYAQSVSLKIYSQNQEKRGLYCEILLYSYLSGICSGRVALYDGHHRASLICENSIKKEGNLKRTLQTYFSSQDGDTNQCNAFPKHLQDAIDYFKDKYHEKLEQFQSKYTRTPTPVNAQAPAMNRMRHDPYQPHRGQSGSAIEYRNHPYAYPSYQPYPPSPPSEYDQNVNHLMTKMNAMRRRNTFLEQQLAHYREQQRLDHERITLLERQLTFNDKMAITPPFAHGDNVYNPSNNHNRHSNDEPWMSSSSTSWNMDPSGCTPDIPMQMQSPFPIPISLPSQSAMDMPLPKFHFA
eukprot:501843_1